ncbi:DivIVA domain-containing protein [Granulicoccus phenolivorans]|uniref:DivIVA domain-containing protein n=1 Tax=Granulicoccus phenolivorans TaxID=266854 RepID=UPI00041B465B|nr:DivIVA domain-containing protein [Granulicoccus phenolivorans]
MQILIVVLAVLILGVAAVVATGMLGGMDPEPDRDRSPLMLPPGALTADQVRQVRFDVNPIGYDMSQVDELLGKLSGQLAATRPSGGPVPDQDWAPPMVPTRPVAGSGEAAASQPNRAIPPRPRHVVGEPAPRRSASPNPPVTGQGTGDPAATPSADAE